MAGKYNEKKTPDFHTSYVFKKFKYYSIIYKVAGFFGGGQALINMKYYMAIN